MKFIRRNEKQISEKLSRENKSMAYLQNFLKLFLSLNDQKFIQTCDFYVARKNLLIQLKKFYAVSFTLKLQSFQLECNEKNIAKVHKIKVNKKKFFPSSQTPDSLLCFFYST